MAGPVSICCCDPPRPAYVEEKQFVLVVPFAGESKFVAAGIQETGYVTRRYCHTELVRTDAAGLTHRVTRDYDHDNGSWEETTATDVGYAGPTGGTISSSFDDDSYAIGYADGASAETFEMSDPIELEDVIAAWRTRLDAIIATASLHDLSVLTFRAGAYGASGADPLILDWDWPHTASASRIHIRPWKGWEDTPGPTYGPINEYPWDETFYVEYFETASAVSGTEYERMKVYGASGFPSLNGIYPPLPVWNGSAWQVYIPTFDIQFIKTSLSVSRGMNCSLSTFGGLTNYELGDVVVGAMDYSSGLVSQTATNLELLPGIYNFDGLEMITVSGGIVGGGGDGIDSTPSPFYPCVWPRITVTGPTDDIRMVGDYCP